MVAKGASLCKGKSVKTPNRCNKVYGCKVAKGTKRSFCRKARNHTKKARQSPTSAEKKSMRRRRILREFKKLR